MHGPHDPPTTVTAGGTLPGVADPEAVRRAIEALEARRGTLADDVVDTALAALHAQLDDDGRATAHDASAARERDVPSHEVLDADTPIVGRDVELGVLTSAYDDVVERGRARVVNLIGDPGLGKSRLLGELRGRIEREDHRARVLAARCDPDWGSTPRSVLRSLVAQLLEIRGDDPSTEVATKLRRELRSPTSREAEVAGHWLGFDLGDSEAVRDLTGNPEIGTIASGHVITHLRRLLTGAPVVVLLDDLHCSDPESLDTIGLVVDAFHDAPMLVVCAARPTLFEQRPRWSAGPRDATTTIELSPLDDDSRRRLVRSLLPRIDGGDGELDEVVESVADGTGGNPFHAEQRIRMLVDDGVVSTDRAALTIEHGRLEHDRAPATLRDTLRARLDALAPDDRTVLEHASVIGQTFWDDAVVSSMATSGSRPSTHTDVASSLARLRTLGFVERHPASRFAGCREYAIAHPLLRAAASDAMGSTERASVHRAAAGWIERRSGDRIGERLGVLAEHLARAGELDRAADLLHEAGARAGSTGAVQSAVGFHRRSLACRDETGRGHDVAATSTRIELAHLLAAAGEYDEAAATYAAAESDARRTGSRRLAATAAAGALRTAAARGDWDEAERLVERVRPHAELFGGEILGRFLSGHALLLIDGPHQDLEAAGRLTERALEIWRESGDAAAELRAINELALVSRKAERPEDADRWYDEGLDLARRVGDTSGEWMLLQNRAVLAHLDARAGRTDYERVLELYRSSLDRRRRLGLPFVLSLANLAQAEVEAGRLDDGRRNAREALHIGWERHDPLDWTIALIALAQSAFVDGELDDGLTILGALLAERRTPSLEREIDAVLEFHAVDRSVAARTMQEAAGTDLTSIVARLLRDTIDG